MHKDNMHKDNMHKGHAQGLCTRGGSRTSPTTVSGDLRTRTPCLSTELSFIVTLSEVASGEIM